MTPDQIQDSLAETIGKAILGKTATAGATDAAAAVMALVGPKPLVWRKSGRNSLSTATGAAHSYTVGMKGGAWRYAVDLRMTRTLYSTPEDAQAAAQAHADAAHWGRMVLADMIGGE